MGTPKRYTVSSIQTYLDLINHIQLNFERTTLYLFSVNVKPAIELTDIFIINLVVLKRLQICIVNGSCKDGAF